MSFYPRKFINVGTFSSTAHVATTKALNSANTANVRLYGDDGAVALTAGAYRTGVTRTLVTTAIVSGDISIYGHQAQVRVNANVASSGLIGGLWALAEVTAGKTVTNIGAVVAELDIPATAVIAASSYAAAIIAMALDVNCTHTGKVSVIHVPAPLAGVYDAFASFVGTTGATGTTYGSINANLCLKVLVDGTTYKIPLYATS